jgi:NAD-dependent deacetylase
MVALDLRVYRRIVVLTGAGVSAPSGLPTYRGPDGLWERDSGRAQSFAERTMLERDPRAVWRFFEAMREQVITVKPNRIHHSLVRLEQSLSSEQRFVILTQNVDGLHQKAGSRDVVELHGSLARCRCLRGCDGVLATVDRASEPRCPDCGQGLRHDVVLFGEPMSVDSERAAKTALRDCDLFLAVGTSGTVAPASSFVRGAKYAGARTLLVNLTPMSPRNDYFDEELIGDAVVLLPQLLGLDG